MPNKIALVFPHQLFKENPLFSKVKHFYLVEEFLFFKQYKFHKQKIAFHRATMKVYQDFLIEKGFEVTYIDSQHKLSDIREFKSEIEKEGITEVNVINPTDNWLLKHIRIGTSNVDLKLLENPLFLNTEEELAPFFREDKKSFFQTTFYKQQRTKRNILVDANGDPKGGKWTYDTENRKKYPKSKTPPSVHFPASSPYWEEAVIYTETNFNEHFGELSKNRTYPITFEESNEWLEQFLTFRFFDFGSYEDAILKEQSILNHSLLSPLLNVGLITPQEVLAQSLAYAEGNDIPLNSIEGFVRQIIGWREFIRGMYHCKGTYARTRNFWGFKRKIPKSFYNGTTGIEPIDDSIKKTLKTGYAHHIERLMILGNFMLLCEFDPNEVYQWFMELFIDAYDWVMVPNVYGMCLFADGGTFATKPYISGSNYIKKMSNYTNGEWCSIWDGLFWRFISEHQDFFKSNPRTSMLLNTFKKMNPDKQNEHMNNANLFLKQLDS